MKKAITSMAAAVILAVGVPAAAMNCHGGGHGSSGSHDSHKMESHKMKDHHSDMSHDEMSAGKNYSEADLISGEEAEAAAFAFMENNMHGFKVGKLSLDEENICGIPVYEAEVTLADSSTGILLIDALNGEPMGIMMGEYADAMRNPGQTASTKGDGAAKIKPERGVPEDHSTHSH